MAKHFQGEYTQGPEEDDPQSGENWTRAMQGVKLNGGKGQEGERRRENMARQERKIVRFFSSDNPDAIDVHDVELFDGEEERVLEGMRLGVISTEDERDFLWQIEDSIDQLGRGRVFRKIKDNRRYCQIIATLTGKGFENWQSVTSADMMAFRGEYDTPFDFTDDRSAFMESIREEYSPEIYEKYAESMREFERVFFGKRQEYYEALMDMHKKASRIDFYSAANNTTTWHEAREIETRATSDAQEDERRKEDMARQQRKIVRFFSSGDSAVIDSHDVDLRPGEEWSVLSRMKDYRIGDADEKMLLESIENPVDTYGEDLVFSQIGGTRHYCRIIATLTGKGFDDWQSVAKGDMVKFLDKYPTPSHFKAGRDKFMNTIRKSNSPQKYEEYVKSMNEFEHIIFGKCQEYYEALMDMRKKAMDMPDEVNAEGYSVAESINRPLSVKRMSNSESLEALRKSRIEGDPMRFSISDDYLTAEVLERADLAPTYKVEFGDASIALSKRFQVRTRDAVIAYVKKEGSNEYVVRSYYRSNSQGVWRFLPDYVPLKDFDGEIYDIDWFGKGYSEESLTLPADMQRAMAMLDREPLAQGADENPEFLFFGTAQQYESRHDYLITKDARGLRNSAYNEISSRPAVEFAGDPYALLPPEKVGVNNEEQNPDFSKIRGEYDTSSGIYGDIHVRTFLSKNGELLYSFNEDSRGRVWIGGIEYLGGTNSAGLRRTWVEGGNLSTPLYEYNTQAGEYGDYSERKEYYVCMWRNYLSKVPMIKEYKSIYG
ncbi:MAG: DndE family protein [Candidatus Saccharibacteria bacterium]|nr:DndE family protein [Candidatus Saccharibacteria bacterium]